MRFPPPSGLALWWRAEDLSGYPDGTGVASWPSRNGVSLASQATAGFQPTKQTDANGKICARFDGVDDRLALSGDALTFSQNVGGITIALRARSNTAAGTTIVYNTST